MLRESGRTRKVSKYSLGRRARSGTLDGARHAAQRPTGTREENRPLEIALNGSVVLLPVLYTLLVIGYGRLFGSTETGVALIVRPVLIATVALHLVFVVLRSIDVGACPLGSRWDYCSLVALSIACVYLALELRSRTRATGVFVITAAFVLQLTASVAMLSTQAPVPAPLGTWPSVRALAEVVAFSAMAVSSIYGLLYLSLYGTIKGGRYGVFFRRVPNLEILSSMNYQAAVLATIALTSSLAVGVAYGHRERVAVTLGVWALFVACVAGRRYFHLGGKRLAWVTALGLPLAGVMLLYVARDGGGA